MSGVQEQTDLLREAGRVLLEYNESTAGIHRALTLTAQALTDKPCHVMVSYDGVAVALAGHSPTLGPVRELRYNTAVQAHVHQVLGQVRRGELGPSGALASIAGVEAVVPRHPRWLVALLLGVAAWSLAIILGADSSAAIGAGLAAGLGLFARQELGRRHLALLLLPFTAALIGGLLGGLIGRMGWTQTPELALVVPALMLIPGPHLINGLLDLIDNYLPMSLARFGLAFGILFASAAGLAIGVELTLPHGIPAHPALSSDHLSLISDVVLAAIVTCGFAAFYNTTWQHLVLAMLGGMAGHGVRFVAMKVGCSLEAATFLGGLTVGIVSGWIAASRAIPVAVIGFAGAVPMIPGLSIYRALGGAWRIARHAGATDPGTFEVALSNALEAALVVSALALGLLLGARVVLGLASAAEVRTRRPRPDAVTDNQDHPELIEHDPYPGYSQQTSEL